MFVRGNLSARSFGKVQYPAAASANTPGRPRTSDGKQRVTVSLRREIVDEYEREAARRWPDSERRRGEVMEEALVSWMLAESLKHDRCPECGAENGEPCVLPNLSTRSAPPSPASKPLENGRSWTPSTPAPQPPGQRSRGLERSSR